MQADAAEKLKLEILARPVLSQVIGQKKMKDDMELSVKDLAISTSLDPMANSTNINRGPPLAFDFDGMSVVGRGTCSILLIVMTLQCVY